MKFLKTKKWIHLGLIIILLLLLFIWACNYWIEKSTAQQVYNDINKLPKNDVALVLGTSKYTTNGYQNPYFYYRIEAAAKLYHTKKIKHIIVSGDNRFKSYNEPKEMQHALEKKGIPSSAITLDYAGFRTLDSVVRSKEVFGQKRITIVSQKFHNHRALFIANRRGIDAIAYNAQDIGIRQGLKTMLREYLARCKAVLDIVLLNKQPKFLGEKIIINI